MRLSFRLTVDCEMDGTPQKRAVISADIRAHILAALPGVLVREQDDYAILINSFTLADLRLGK